MDKFKALNHNVILQEVFLENKTESGFTLTSEVDANEKQKKGKIISVGTECPKNFEGKDNINVGDTVVFDKYKSTPFTHEGVTYLIVYYSDLVMVL